MNEAQKNALAELQHKTLKEIQIETAFTWAYRAWAAKRLGLVHDYVEYLHEAVEHGALSDDDAVLARVKEIAQ